MSAVVGVLLLGLAPASATRAHQGADAHVAPASAGTPDARAADLVEAVADEDCHCTGDFVKPSASAPAFIAAKAPAKDANGLDAKKKYRAEGEGQNLAIYSVDKSGANQDLVLSIPGPTSFGFSPDSDRLLTTYGASTMRLYDLTSPSDQPIWTQDVAGASYGFSGKGDQLIELSGTTTAGSAVVFDVVKHTTVAMSSDIVGSADDIVGLSPKNSSLLVETPDGKSAALYSFPGRTRIWSHPADTYVSSYAFSPDGSYLAQSTVTTTPGTVDQQHFSLLVYDISASGGGKQVYQTDFDFGLAPGKKGGDEATAFGPRGGVLQLAYNNPDAQSASVFVRNLVTDTTVFSANPATPGSTFSFSPCGDVWAIVEPTATSTNTVALFSTTDGTQIANALVGTGGAVKLSATDKDFTVTVGSGTPQVLAPNPHGKSCTDAPPSAVKSLALKDSTVSSGGSTTGTVALASTAPSDIAITLKADAGATVPATVTVPAGTDSATFDLTAAATASVATVTVTASLGGSSASAALVVNPPKVSALSVSSNTVVGGQPLVGTVTLDGTAPAGGIIVTLGSSNRAVTVPASVTVPAGEHTMSVDLTTSRVDRSTPATVTATAGSSHASATVTVAPVQVAAITLPDDSNPISSDVSFHVTVRLNGTADAAHTVTLRSSDPAALTVPDSVVVPAGASSAQVLLTPVPQWRSDPDHPLAHPTWTVLVTAADVTASAALDVRLASPVMLNYARFEGGDNQVAHAGRPVDLEIALDRSWNIAVEGNSKTVTLSTDQPNLVSLPLAPDGKPGFVITESSDDDLSNATWERYTEIRVRPVAQPTTATITVSIGGLDTELTLEVEPPDQGVIYTIAGSGTADSEEIHLQPGDDPIDPLRADLCGCAAEVPSPVKDVVVASDGTVFASYTSPDPNPDYHPAGIPSGIARVDASGLTRYADLTGQLDLAGADDPHIRSGQLDLAADGTLYVSTGHSVLAVSTAGTVTTVPGSTGIGEIADVTVGVDGVLYLADWTHRRVWRLGRDGVATVYVGTGVDGSSGDGGPAVDAKIGRAYLDINPLGVLYLGDIDHHVLRAVAADGTISTIAGTGEAGIADDGDDVATALVDDPNPTATPGGGVLFSDETVVQFLSPSGQIYRIAGSGSRGFFGDGRRADDAQLSRVGGVAFDGSGNVYIADAENSRVREVGMAYQLFDVSPVTVSGVTDFGDVAVGSVGDVVHLTVTNGADWSVTLAGLDVVDQPVDGVPVGDFLISADTCTGAVLQPAQSCSVDVALRPLGPDQRYGALQVHISASGTQIDSSYPIAELSGTGVAPPFTDPTDTGQPTVDTSLPTSSVQPPSSAQLPTTNSSEPTSTQRSTTDSNPPRSTQLATPTDSIPQATPSGSFTGGTATQNAEVAVATVAPGDTQTVSADGFAPGEDVHGWLHSQPIDLGITQADAHGHVRLTFVVPIDLEPGEHTVELLGVISGRDVQVGFRVIAPPAATTLEHPSLSATGLPTATLIALALLLLGAGGFLLTRRSDARRRQPPRP